MDDYARFCSVATAQPFTEDDLERSAQALIAKLESFGQGVDGSDVKAAMPAAFVASHEEAPASSHYYEDDAASALQQQHLDAGMSQASDGSNQSGGGQSASARLYERARAKQSAAAAGDDGKENGVHAPAINARSKQLAGKRDGAIGERLHEEAIEREARRQRAIEEAQARQEAEALEGASSAVPEINGVSAQLTAGRMGAVADRLFESHKESARKHEDRIRDAQREAEAAARPNVSEGSTRIAALLPGREAPVQDRLYACAAERQVRRRPLIEVACDRADL